MKFATILLILGLAGCSQPEPKHPPLKVWVPVSGKSMLPTFPESALVEIEIGVPFSQLKAGDSGVFWDYTRTQSDFIHHRLVAYRAGGWVTKGDNPETNKGYDAPWLLPEHFVGRATGRHTQILFVP